MIMLIIESGVVLIKTLSKIFECFVSEYRKRPL